MANPTAFKPQKRTPKASEKYRRIQEERASNQEYWDNRLQRTIDGGRVIRKELSE